MSERSPAAPVGAATTAAAKPVGSDKGTAVAAAKAMSLGPAKPPATAGKSTPASTVRSAPGGRAGIERWVEAVLLAARHIGISTSPELVRSASAWTAGGTADDAIIGIAQAAGLTAQFVDVRAGDFSRLLLPVLMAADDKNVGMIVAIAGGRATFRFMVGDKVAERTMALDQLPGGATGLRVLMVSEREAVRDERLEGYLAPAPKSWLKDIFTSNPGILVELGLGSLVGNLLAIGTSLFAMQVWDRVVPARATNTLWVLASGVMLALVLELLIKTARISIADKFGKQADLKLSAMFFARVLDIRNDARPRSPGTLISQLRDLEQLRELLTSSTLGVLIDLPFVFAFLFVIWTLGGSLAFVPLIAIPLQIIPGLLAQMPLAKLSTQGMNESALRNAILMESIYRVEDIKTLQAEPRFRNLWDKANRVAGDIGLKQRFLAGLLVNWSQMVQQLAYVGVVACGVYAILDNTLSFGAVLACSILTSRTIAPLGQISAILGRVQNARIGKKGLDNLLSLPVDHDPQKDRFHKPSLAGRYRFENVAYAYGPMEKPALVIPQLRIEAGEKIGILGRVGAGKSTFLRLAGRLAAPAQGRILLDDTIMNTIDIADIRRDVGFVLQESGLFYGTLRENVLIGNPLASDQQILEAMRFSRADQLVLNQPRGLDLQLRESGIGLSGGQKQAVLLARMLLRSPNILLLDEPTAALDEPTELAIIENMKGWLGRRTLILATHRYAPLALVDRIIVIDGGRIVRDGPKDEILAALAPATTRQPKVSRVTAKPMAAKRVEAKPAAKTVAEDGVARDG